MNGDDYSIYKTRCDFVKKSSELVFSTFYFRYLCYCLIIEKESGSMTERKIIHIDMDAFYASVEQRDHPER